MSYCLIEQGAITAGPKAVPKAWKNISGLNLLPDERLKMLGWLPYVNTKPSFDADTQYLTSEKVIGENEVTETYTVNDYTVEELALNLATAKSVKLSDLYANVKQFINYQSSGWPRYDNDLKLNVMNAVMTAIAASQSKPANCALVETWIYTVQTEFFALKIAITGAETIASLEAIDVSTNYFETKYGREGTTLADPGISTDDLFS